ncbi:hypothetical protein V6N13_090129 [Hibiscus sabdariffa]
MSAGSMGFLALFRLMICTISFGINLILQLLHSGEQQNSQMRDCFSACPSWTFVVYDERPWPVIELSITTGSHGNVIGPSLDRLNSSRHLEEFMENSVL